MTGEVIKSFLVGLGFGVDDTSLAKFNKSIAGASLKVAGLYAATVASAGGIVAGISQISEGFEQMGYEYRLIIPAVNKAIQLRREMLKAYSAAGINIQKVVLDSVKLNFSLAKTKFAFEAIYKSVASKFFGVLAKQSDLFRQKIYANMPRIQAALERFVNFVFKALDAMTQLGLRLWSILSRVFDLFLVFNKATDGWAGIILGIVAAWQLLNLEFLATPLGMILAGLLAILALYDDFKVWQEGGKSFFDWSAFVPVINATGDALKSVWEVLVATGEALGNLAAAFYLLFSGDFTGAWDALGQSGENIINIFMRLWDVVKNVGSALGNLGGWALKTFGNAEGQQLGQNIANSLAPVNQSAPLGSNTNTTNASTTNQHVNQQTTINVTGSADAQQVGKRVAGEQSQVNFDLTRNLKGATR